MKVVYSRTAKKSVNAVDNNGNTAGLNEVLKVWLWFQTHSIARFRYKGEDLL